MVKHLLNHIIYHTVLNSKGQVSVAITSTDKNSIEESMAEE